MTSSAVPENTGKARGRPTMVVTFALVLGMILVLLVIFSHRGLYQTYRLKQERARLDQENARLAEENTRLARTVDRLHNDPAMIQDLIRRELNFVKKNEVIIQLSPAGKDKPTTAALLPDKPPPPHQGGTANSHPRGRQQKAVGSQKKTP